MTRNETIKLRIAELEGRLGAARQLVMNKQMIVEQKLIEGQIAALKAQIEIPVFVEVELHYGDPGKEIVATRERAAPIVGRVITKDKDA